MKKRKIAATGLDGLVGSRIFELLKDEFHFIPITQDEMDITVEDQVESVLSKLDFDLFLHLAAYTNVDNAEIEKKLAWQINVEGTKNVFKSTMNKNKDFVYISTDFVFDGTLPYSHEQSIPNPLCYYGLTKREGEKIVEKNAMIVRISYPYRAKFDPKKDIVRNIISLLEGGKKFHGVTDNKITFTFIDDIAYALKFLFENYSKEIFHIVGSDRLSGYEAILKICEVFNFDKGQVYKTSSDDFYKGRATRPKNGTIVSKKNNFYKMSSFLEGVVKVKKQLLDLT